MKTAITILISLLPTLAYAETLEERIRVAKAAEAAEPYAPYQRVMFDGVGNYLAGTMRACFESVKEPQTDAFVLVADIASSGKAQHIEVRPSTNISRCFAAGVKNAAFPKPPVYPERSGFPIVLEMNIKP